MKLSIHAAAAKFRLELELTVSCSQALFIDEEGWPRVSGARKVLFGRGVRVEDRMLIGDTIEHDVRPVILYVYGSARYSTDGHCKTGSRIRAWQSDPQIRGKVRWCRITASVRHQQ